jgi:hypothetical protein
MTSLILSKAGSLNSSIIVLTIDIGNGVCDKLRIHDIDNYQEESYDFCAKNNLDFNTMKEINSQIEKVILDNGLFHNNTSRINKDNNKLIYQKKIKEKKYKQSLVKKKGNSCNKKIIKRHNEKPLICMSQRMKDSNKNNNNSVLMSNYSKGNTSTSTTTKYSSSIKEFNSKNKENNNTKNNINNKILYHKEQQLKKQKSHNKKNEEFIKSKKIKESIEILNQGEINNNNINKNEKNKKDEIMILEFDSNNNSNKVSLEQNNLNETNKFNNILNSINLSSRENIFNSNSERILYKNNKTESNEPQKNINKKNEFKLSNIEQIKNYKKYKDEKIKNLKEKQEKKFKEICTFRPLINKNINIDLKTENNEEKIKHKKTKTSSRFEKLYGYRINYKENKEKLSIKYEKKYSFHPKINSKSCYPLTKISFNERLKLYSNKSKDALNKLQKDIERKNLNVLLSSHKLNDSNENNNINNKKSVCSPMSNILFNHKKAKCFKNIFKLLDGDNDGKISSININYNNIPYYIRKILEPIFIELKNENETLSESEFIFICDKLYESLKYEVKQKLISFNQEEQKKQIKEKKLGDNSCYTYRKIENNKKINRVSSCEIIKNKEYKKINYYFSKPKYLMQINNFINEDKKLRESNDMINSISLSSFIQNKNKNIEIMEINDDIHLKNIFNKNTLVIQNLNDKIDKEIKI